MLSRPSACALPYGRSSAQRPSIVTTSINSKHKHQSAWTLHRRLFKPDVRFAVRRGAAYASRWALAPSDELPLAREVFVVAAERSRRSRLAGYDEMSRAPGRPAVTRYDRLSARLRTVVRT